jgi:hypothetical protein
MAHSADRTFSKFLELIGGHIPVSDKNALHGRMCRLKFRKYDLKNGRVASVRVQDQQISKARVGNWNSGSD